MSLAALGVLGRSTVAVCRTHFHSSVVLRAKNPAKKRHRSLKRELDFQAQKQILVDFIRNGSLDGLHTVKEKAISAGDAVDQLSFDTNFLQTCSELGAFNLGRDFFNKLHSEGRAGVGLIGKYFSMCQTHREQCNAEDQRFLLKLYDDLLKKHGMLDARTCESIAKGIVLTDRWKIELPRLIAMVSLSDATPSSSLISTAVCGALYQRDIDAAWKYMDLFIKYDKPVLSETYENILKYGAQLSRLLRWMENNGVLLYKDSAEVLVRLGASHGAKVKSTRVPQNGVCRNCRKPLKPTDLSNEEFSQLHTAFLDPVLIGRDVFLKTRPEELKAYHSFLDQVLPVDVVLDGLNIAYCSGQMSSQGSKLLCSVASHFAVKSKKILVIGRQHMKTWPARDMKFIYDRAKVFLAEDISQDDPFLLYATLRSGIGTKFVSRDKMSSHRFLLKSPDLRRIFTKWQTLHQYHPLHISLDGSQVALKEPAKFSRAPQNTSQGLWHLPVVDHSLTNIDGHLQDENSPWICVQI